MKKLIFLILLIIPIMSFSQDKKTYFIHLSSDPMINPSAAMMSIHAASEALKQGHNVTYFAAGDGVRILIKDVINNLHTVTPHGGRFGKISQMAKRKLLEFSNNGGVIHVSEGSFNTFGINQNNYGENLIDVKNIYWSYPKELIQESSKADIVFSY
jgi:predicted peroxiredoxin